MNQPKEKGHTISEFALASHGVPVSMWGGLQLYFSDGILPGDFLTAVLQNNLCEAVASADDESKLALADVVRFLALQDVPGDSWGSPERVRAWTARFTPAPRG